MTIGTEGRKPVNLLDTTLDFHPPFGLTRRSVLAGMAAGAVAPLTQSCSARDELPDIPEPPEIRSRNGRLEAVLEAAPSRITVGGRSYLSNVWNGLYIPPVLVIGRGEEARIRLINNIARSDLEIDGPEPTNLHTHGMATPPRQPGDYIYIGIPSGAPLPPGAPDHAEHGFEAPVAFPDGSGRLASNIYEFRWRVPAHHPQGPHWYHPHAHGIVENQVLNGMSGLLIIDGFLATHYPELARLRQRRIILKDFDVPDDPQGSPHLKTINGMTAGAIRMRPGDIEVWDIGNVGADAYFDFAIDGHRFWVLGHDANVMVGPGQEASIFLPPGARATAVIQAGDAGRYSVRSLEVDTGPAGDPNPTIQLATLVVEGRPSDHGRAVRRLSQPAANRASVQPTLEQVAALPVTRSRTITFSENDAGTQFYIDGKQFDYRRDDITVTLGEVEEWTLLNTTGERHVFHMHQLDFLVQQINDDDADYQGLRDVIDMPYARSGQPGRVQIKIPFTDPVIPGRFPFHCHILEHEDGGMMATVRVLPRADAGAPPA
jgi:FtsP/CotA-like multicopper oxidase with cupredoxin domain